MQAEARPQSPVHSTGYAVFGGVFDPVHNAHLAAARAALADLPILEVRFIPAGVPPHKNERVPASADHRRRLLELAIAGEPRFVLDDRELRRPGPSYTVDTLEELSAERAGERIYFLVGADNIRTIGSWYRSEEILSLCDPVIVPRPGYPDRFSAVDLPSVSEARREELNGLALRGICLDRSSSEIRRRVKEGLPLAACVPSAVAEYIEAEGLYRV